MDLVHHDTAIPRLHLRPQHVQRRRINGTRALLWLRCRAVTVGSDALPGVRRSFNRFSDAAREAAVSRLYGGIHTRAANEDGLLWELKSANGS